MSQECFVLLIRVLGAHKLENKDSRHTCFLVDGKLAVDAGSVSGCLTFEEQCKVEAVLLTHSHFDHVRDIPTLALSTLHNPGAIEVWGLQETLKAVHDNFLNFDIYPDLTQPLGCLGAKINLQTLEPEVSFSVLGYEVKAVPLEHSVPNVGYSIRSSDGSCIGYTGDTSGGLSKFFLGSDIPSILFVDVSFPNHMEELAHVTGHMTPNMLRKELSDTSIQGFKQLTIVPVHLSQHHQADIHDELQHVAQETGFDITVGYEDMVIEIG